MNTTPIGQRIGQYVLKRALGQGAMGTVYHAVRSDDIPEERAVKLIPRDCLRQNWENEIRKVVRLRFTPGVVRYHEHGETRIAGQDYVWISWDFIPGRSLREMLGAGQVSIPMVCAIVERLLEVLHACRRADVQHGDLHAGNIMIQDQDALGLDPDQRTVWVTDFGYCTASMGKEMLDDYVAVARIILDCVSTLDFHSLDGKDKHIFSILKGQFSKYLLETNQTEGDYVRNPSVLRQKFRELREMPRTRARSTEKHIADYLAAELIGDRYDEWKQLFVPEFLASSSVLDRNICVVTGLRGCGKTMIFRRLTALFDCHLGPSGVPRSDSFIGCYLNARTVAEAFPWLPETEEANARNQILHYFHTGWALEVLDWLAMEARTRDLDLNWLYGFFSKALGVSIPSVSPTDVGTLRAHLAQEQQRAKLHTKYAPQEWKLTDLAFLDTLLAEVARNCGWIDKKPFYCF